jgi:hypothetical protein
VVYRVRDSAARSSLATTTVAFESHGFSRLAREVREGPSSQVYYMPLDTRPTLAWHPAQLGKHFPTGCRERLRLSLSVSEAATDARGDRNRSTRLASGP